MAPTLPAPVAAALAKFPAPVQTQLLEIRALIFDIAQSTEGVGPLTECLKWREPAYLTEATRSGSTIRLGATKIQPDHAVVFLNCQTTLIETFRQQFDGVFTFDKNRALILAPGVLPLEPLALCLHAALTYHRRTR